MQGARIWSLVRERDPVCHSSWDPMQLNKQDSEVQRCPSMRRSPRGRTGPDAGSVCLRTLGFASCWGTLRALVRKDGPSTDSPLLPSQRQGEHGLHEEGGQGPPSARVQDSSQVMERSGSFRINKEGVTPRVKASLVEASLERGSASQRLREEGAVGKIPPGGETAGAGAGLSEGTARRTGARRAAEEDYRRGRGAGERPGLRRSRLFGDTPRGVETQGRRRERRGQKAEGTPVFPCLPSAVSSSVLDTQAGPEESALPHPRGLQEAWAPASHAGQGPALVLSSAADRPKTEPRTPGRTAEKVPLFSPLPEATELRKHNPEAVTGRRPSWEGSPSVRIKRWRSSHILWAPNPATPEARAFLTPSRIMIQQMLFWNSIWSPYGRAGQSPTSGVRKLISNPSLRH